MAKKKEHSHDNINCNLVLLWFAVVALFICVAVFRFEIDNIKEENEFLKKGNEFINFSVICDGNGIIAQANYSLNDYDLYKRMIKIYDTKNCKINDVKLGADE